MERRIKLLGTGGYLPKKIVTAEEVDLELGFPLGTTLKKSGVQKRHFSTGEKATEMATVAAQMALKNAGISAHEIDAIVCGHSVPEQPIPSNAALLQRHLGLQNSKIPCFDVNSTCLSFVTAVDLVSHAMAAGAYRNVLVVASEVASVGLTKKDHEVISLFGDGAGAAVFQRTPDTESSRILSSHMETFSDGYDFCEIRGGGTGLYASNYTAENHEEYMFHMSGPKVFKLALNFLPAFFDKLLSRAGVTLEDVKLVVPHQASGSALALLQRKLGIPAHKFLNILPDHGNMVAASIPYALHHALQNGLVSRGDKIILCGTSAGVSIGGMVLEF